MIRTALPAALLALCAGCGAPPPEEGEPVVGTAEQAVEAANGLALNGVSLNGKSLNGKSLNGKSLNGVRLSGATLSAALLPEVTLQGSSIVAAAPDGGSLTGAQLVGARLAGELSDGSTLTLRIDGVGSAPSPNSDIAFYSVSFDTDAGWMPLCDYDNEAVALTGVWNHGSGVPGGGSKIDDGDRFTFGCRYTALAKCVELGYKPWATSYGESLAECHQSCVRAIRADYCGDGQSFTVDGTLVNIFDRLGVQPDTESWSFESNWTPAGATCISSPRLLSNLDYGAVPDCVAYRATQTCSTGSWPSGVRVRTEVAASALDVKADGEAEVEGDGG